MISTRPSQDQLEEAAQAVIRLLKTIPEYANAKIALIGGLAFLKYFPDKRKTHDVDFIVDINNAPRGVKNKLLALPNSPFIQKAQGFYYKSPSGNQIQVDITPGWQSPYMPTAATKLRDIQPGVIPYISAVDLLMFKINSCGLRADTTKKLVDAVDALTLLEKLTDQVSLHLTSASKAIVEGGINDVVALDNDKPMAWWRGKLGLPASS